MHIIFLFVVFISWLYVIHRREQRYIQQQKTEMNGSAPDKTDGNQNPVFVISDECMEKVWMNINRMEIEIMTIFKKESSDIIDKIVQFSFQMVAMNPNILL